MFSKRNERCFLVIRLHPAENEAADHGVEIVLMGLS